MKKPEEIKKDLIDCMEEAIEIGKTCDAQGILDFSDKVYVCMATTRAYIQQLEAGIMAWEDVASSPGAVEDMAIEINRLQAELVAVKRERDAAVDDWKRAALHGEAMCMTCKFSEDGGPCFSPVFCVDGECWQWRGVCKENKEMQANE